MAARNWRTGGYSGPAGMRVGDFSFTVKDLEQLGTTLRGMDREFKTEIQRELRQIGYFVRDEIRSRTPVQSASKVRRATLRNQGTVRWNGADYSLSHRPGTLKRRTNTRVRDLEVKIFNSAKRASRSFPKGYRYGKRIEFDPRHGGRFAFFYPGFEAVKEEAVRRWKAVCGKVAAAQWTRKVGV